MLEKYKNYHLARLPSSTMVKQPISYRPEGIKNIYGQYWLVIGDYVAGLHDVRPRLGTFTNPWSAVSNTIFAPPPIRAVNDSLNDLLDQRATELLATQRKLAVMWSGGIDSTCVLVALLKHLQHQDQLVVYMTDVSIAENPEFYKKFEPALMDDFKTFQLTDCQHAPASAWNKLARIAYYDAEINYDYFFQIGDDVELLTSGWTTQFITKLKEHNNIGVVGPCYKENYDGRIRDGNPPVIENAFVHRKHLDIFGYFFHPSIKNWFCDDWINRIYDGIFSEIQVDIECINTVLGNRYNVENIYYTYKEIIEKSKQSLIPKKVFSYCVFGTNPKYCKGMIRNLEQISELFPEYETWIYLGNDVPQEYIDQYKTFNNVKLIPTLNNTL